MLAKEHSKDTFGHGHFLHGHPNAWQRFRALFQSRREASGIRSSNRGSRMSFPMAPMAVLIRYVDAAGKRVEEAFDIVVLSVGWASARGAGAGRAPGDRNRPYGFACTSAFEPVKTSVPGIYVCGGFEAPMDIPSSVVQSSAAAGAAGSLTDARWTMTTNPGAAGRNRHPRRTPRIGVFICRCGTNIASVVDVPRWWLTPDTARMWLMPKRACSPAVRTPRR
jgi:heterodisulfide reductase subunit A2